MADFFITATDTDAGKTFVACALVNALVRAGKKIAVFKPVSAGCELNSQGLLVNEDALSLQKQANANQHIKDINPIRFIEPIAPHIAAQKLATPIDIETIEAAFVAIQSLSTDHIICEGAGGWRLPLGEGIFLSDFVKQSKMDVILVVNMKLGCLNHAVLTYESIINDGLDCIAWVANFPEKMPYLTENIAELTKLLPIPLLAELGFTQDISRAAEKFNLQLLPALNNT